jgi:hypothetical protein
MIRLKSQLLVMSSTHLRVCAPESYHFAKLSKVVAAQVAPMHAGQLLMLLMRIAEDDWQHLKYTFWNASSSQGSY